MTRAKTKLAQSLSAGKSVLTAECLPPASSDPEAVKKLASQLPPALDAVVISDNHHETRGSALACAALLAAASIEPVLPLSTRDKNRIALESDVLGASTLGVKNFLCMTGLHQSQGASPQAASVYDFDSTQLVEAIGKMTDSGLGINGRQLDNVPELFVGATAHPFLSPIELSILQLKKKVLAGADVVWTDPIFDVAGFEVWMKAVRESGLDKKVAIIASVLMLQSPQQAEIIRKKPTGKGITDVIVDRLRQPTNGTSAGLALCAETIAAIKGIAGVRGIHLITGGSPALATQIINTANLA
jgi:methylenetetrahydrofolate reductase (NADPH)